MSRILYINTHAAKYGWYFGRRLPEGYRLAAKFWGSGLLDRTGTLYTGFPYASLYPIPALPIVASASDNPPLAALCDAEGLRIIAEAQHRDTDTEVLWSGGIDSTAALVSLIRASAQCGRLNQLEVLLTEQSVEEYPLFFERIIKPLKHRFVSAPVTTHLNPARLIVTGEHGDQIFGSAKAAHFVSDGRAFQRYPDALPIILAENLGSPQSADTVMRYLEPIFRTCPIPLRSVFDAFWWINFSLKWQIVGLRLAVFRVSGVLRTFRALRHFFSHPSFQLWSLQNHPMKIGQSWESYKMPLKDYIFSHTGDEQYRRTKIKVPSLKAVLRSDVQRNSPTYRVLMDEAFVPVFWPVGAAAMRDSLSFPIRNRGK